MTENEYTAFSVMMKLNATETTWWKRLWKAQKV